MGLQNKGDIGATGIVATVAVGFGLSVDSADAANPVVSLSAMTTATTTQIGDKTHAVNTSNKTKGRTVYNSSTDLMYYALGSADTSKWRLSGAVDATGDVTPA